MLVLHFCVVALLSSAHNVFTAHLFMDLFVPLVTAGHQVQVPHVLSLNSLFHHYWIVLGYCNNVIAPIGNKRNIDFGSHPVYSEIDNI